MRRAGRSRSLYRCRRRPRSRGNHLVIIRELVGEGAFPRHLAFAVEVDHQGRRVLVAGRQHAQVSDIAVAAAPYFLGYCRGCGYAREGEVGQQEGGQHEGPVPRLHCDICPAVVDHAPLERGVDEQFLALEDGEVGASLLDGLEIEDVPLPKNRNDSPREVDAAEVGLRLL